MRNIYYKTKIKEIVDSNIFYTNKENENYSDPDIQQNNESFENKKPKQNKAFNFSCLSENKIFGKEYYEKFLKLINNKANDFQGDIEISIYQNLQEGNQNRKKNLLAIKQMMNDLIDEEESKKGFLALLRQSYLLGKLRSNIVSINLFFIFIIQEDEFIIGVFGKKKAGKSTFINKIFRDCETNNSYANSTIGLNLYTVKDTSNFAIIDSPGDTENDNYLEKFASKGYIYSKLLIYIMNEESDLDADSLRKNEKLNILINLRTKYKIPLLILLTNSDTFCDKVKKSDENWRKICKEHINNNKINLLSYINDLIEKSYNSDFTMNEKDIIHIVLVEPKKISDEEIIKKMPKKTREKYDKADEEKKSIILETFKEGFESAEDEIKSFFEEEMDIYDSTKLINRLKQKLPSQYHSAFNS